MRTWTQLLDDYETTVAALERAAVSGEAPPTRPWEPPPALPADAPTRAERARYVRLQARADACADTFRATLTAAGAELDAVRRTGAAARAYGSRG